MVVRTLIKVAMIGIALLAGAAYIAYLKTGSWLLPTAKAPEIKAPKVEIPNIGLKPKNQQAYKWRDDTGRWRYTTEPPSDGRPFTTVEPLTPAH